MHCEVSLLSAPSGTAPKSKLRERRVHTHVRPLGGLEVDPQAPGSAGLQIEPLTTDSGGEGEDGGGGTVLVCTWVISARSRSFSACRKAFSDCSAFTLDVWLRNW